MSMSTNISNKISIPTFVNHNNRTQQAEQKIAVIDNKINKIDININARKDYIKAIDVHTNNLRKSLTLHKESVALTKESVALTKEGIALDQKRIANNEKIIEAAETLLAKRTARNSSTDIVASPQELNKVKSTSDALLQKNTVIKEHSQKISDKLEKLSIKLDFTEKQISKLDGSYSVEKPVNSTNQFGVSSTYHPQSSQVQTLGLQKLPDVKALVLSDITKSIQEQIYRSQQNIYESVVSNMFTKLV